MGDGINDSPSLTNSDVGISVDTAVDIAKVRVLTELVGPLTQNFLREDKNYISNLEFWIYPASPNCLLKYSLWS